MDLAFFTLSAALLAVGLFVAMLVLLEVGRNRVHMAAFAFTLAGAVYVILDIEYPRAGLIRVDAFDQVLIELRESMN